MASKHQLSLDIQQSSNCGLFKVSDTSLYATGLPVVDSFLQVGIPGFNEPVTISVAKDFDLLVTACVLGIQTSNCGNEADVLPDGVYDIKYSVSPNDQVFVQYHYLRTCQVLNAYYLELCKLELAACEPEPDIKDQLSELRLIKSFLDAAKAKVEECNDIMGGMELFIYAKERLQRFGRDNCCSGRSCY